MTPATAPLAPANSASDNEPAHARASVAVAPHTTENTRNRPWPI